MPRAKKGDGQAPPPGDRTTRLIAAESLRSFTADFDKINKRKTSAVSDLGNLVRDNVAKNHLNKRASAVHRRLDALPDDVGAEVWEHLVHMVQTPHRTGAPSLIDRWGAQGVLPGTRQPLGGQVGDDAKTPGAEDGKDLRPRHLRQPNAGSEPPTGDGAKPH